MLTEESFQLFPGIMLGFFSVFVCFCFLGPHPQHMEAPRRGVQSELQLPAYTRATATPNLSRICGLDQILNLLSEARDWTCILMDTSQVRYHWATTGTPRIMLFDASEVSLCFFWPKKQCNNGKEHILSLGQVPTHWESKIAGASLQDTLTMAAQCQMK